MKRKMKGVLGIGLTFVLLASLMTFAIPVSAAAPLPTINAWTNFTYPAEGATGGWFWDPAITELGPMDKALNGDIYVYALVGTDHKILRSTDGGRSWAESISPLKYGGTLVPGLEVVDMVCSSLLEDVLYVTDGNYVYKSSDNADTWAPVAQPDLENILMGACGTTVTGTPITCLDVGYDASNNPYVFIGVTSTAAGPADILYIDELAIGATWKSLDLSCYDPPDLFTPYAVGVTPDFATAPTKLMVVVSRMASLDVGMYVGGTSDGTAEWAINEADPRGYSAALTTGPDDELGWATAGVPYGGTLTTFSTIGEANMTFWIYYTVAGHNPYAALYLDTDADGVADLMLLNKGPVTANPNEWYPAQPQDEWHVYAYDAATGVIDGSGTTNLAGNPDSNVWHSLAEWAAIAYVPADGTFGDATVLSVAHMFGGVGGTQGETVYVDEIILGGVTYGLPGETHVISSNLGVCGWGEVAELVWNCNPANHFGINHAARIGYPDDYVDGRTLFVGVTAWDGTTAGGDVYSVVTFPVGLATDLNVAGSVGGCIGLFDGTNICGLDVCGDTADAAVIAGAMDTTDVFTSIDGGWTWVTSLKDPTGVGETWVQWAGDDCGASALAATQGDDCAVSITCADGLYWNQASLINTCFDCVHVVDHSPGYYEAGVSDTLFMLTKCTEPSCYNVFRYVGDPTLAGTSSPAHPWERVFSSLLYAAEIDTENILPGDPIEMLMVSPDFLTTDAVFIGNYGFEIWRSLDAGCSWFKLAFPCAPRPTAYAAIVVDKETVVVGGDGVVYKTTRHGTRHWNAATVTGAGYAMSFDFDGANFLMGDDSSQVFISSDGALTWSQVGAAPLDTTADTSVAFDPGYAVTGDPGENTIYAAAGTGIYRCVIDPIFLMAAQAWPSICTDVDADFWGMVTAGDTALYVGDRAAGHGMVRSLNPTFPVPGLVVFELIDFRLAITDELTGLPLTAGVNGCPNSNVLWAADVCNTGARVWFFEDTLATPVIPASPSDGAKLVTTDSAILEWEKLCTATSYDVELWYFCPGCLDKTFVPVCVADGEPVCCDCATLVPCVGCSGETCCELVSGLFPGTTYYWRARVCIDYPMLSKWSATSEFTTALGAVAFAELCSPPCGGEDISLTTSFSWEPVPGAAGYEVEIATNEDFSPVIASGTPKVNAWAAAPELDYSTTYYWRVRAVRDGVVGAWTTCLFSTEGPPPEPVEPVEPVVIPPVQEITPAWIWVIIGIGAVLVISVIVLIVTTRRVP